MKNVFSRIAYLVCACLVVTGCATEVPPNSNTVKGSIMMPSSQVAAAEREQFLPRLFNAFIGASYADVLGLAPVGNTTVELVRLDQQGNVAQVLDTTTSDSTGNYTFTTSYTPDTTLAVRLPNEPVTTRAIVTSSQVDITPVSEAVVRTIVNEILTPPTSALDNFTVEEVAGLVALVEGMEIDVSTATTFDQAVNIVLTEAGAVLTNMASGYAGAAMVDKLQQQNYAIFGTTTTLIPPPLLNGGSAGIDHRSIDGALGFEDSKSGVKGGSEFSMTTLDDLTTASFFCDADPIRNASYVPATNGQVSVSIDGTGTAGAMSADGKLMVYPTVSAYAGVNGNSSGLGRGIRVAMNWTNLPGQNGANLNPTVAGDYNLVWFASFMNPGGGTMGGGGGGGMGGGGGGLGTFASGIGTAALTFDPTQTDANGRSALSSSGATFNTLTLDLSAGTVSASSGADSISGLYEVLPGNGVIAPLGDTAAMMGGGAGSGDFMQGVKLETPSGVSPLLAFSTWLTGGMMGGGGGMNMGSSGCDSGAGGTTGGGGMMGGGSVTGEGRGLALAALRTSGLTVANVSGTYNAVAQLTGLTQVAGSALIDSEVRYGTLVFDGAGNVSGGSLFYNRATMDAGDAVNGVTTAVSSSTATESFSGTYTVSGTDASATLSLGGLGTGTGFVTSDGAFMVFPILESASGSGRRGLLLLVRQP